MQVHILANKKLVFESKQCEFSAYVPTHYAKLPLHANIINISVLFHKVTNYVIWNIFMICSKLGGDIYTPKRAPEKLTWLIGDQVIKKIF